MSRCFSLNMPNCHAAHEVLDIMAALYPEIGWSPTWTILLILICRVTVHPAKIQLRLNSLQSCPTRLSSCYIFLISYSFTRACFCECMFEHWHTCVWRPEDGSGVVPQSRPSGFWRQDLSLAWSSQVGIKLVVG